MEERAILEELVTASTEVLVKASQVPYQDAWYVPGICMEVLKRCLVQLQIHRSQGGDLAIVRQIEKECRYCGAAIFFAQFSESGKWVPIDVEPIDSGDIPPNWRYAIDFTMPRHPVVYRDMLKTDRTWIAHQNVCGQHDGPKHRIPSMQRRWQVNVERSQKIIDEANTRLKALDARLDNLDI